MSTANLIEELMMLQIEARRQGLEEAFRWLGREIDKLMGGKKPKVKRKRGRWVRVKATGQRVMLDADVIAHAEREELGT